MSFGRHPPRRDRVHGLGGPHRHGRQGEFAAQPLGGLEHRVEQQPQPHVLDAAALARRPAAGLERRLGLAEPGLEPPRLALGGGHLGLALGAHGVGLGRGLALRGLAALDVAERAAQLAVQRVGFLAAPTRARRAAVPSRPWSGACRGELLAQPGQLGPGLLVGPLGVRPLGLLARGGHQLGPAGGAQQIGRGRHVERVGGRRRGARVQGTGQLRLRLSETFADALPEDRVGLQGGGQRGRRVLHPPGRRETGVRPQLAGSSG